MLIRHTLSVCERPELSDNPTELTIDFAFSDGTPPGQLSMLLDNKPTWPQGIIQQIMSVLVVIERHLEQYHGKAKAESEGEPKAVDQQPAQGSGG